MPDGNKTPADYLFDQSYGIGGGALVSQNPTRQWINDLKKRIRAGVLADAGVDPGSDPVIVFRQPQPNTFVIYVGVQLLSGQSGSFSLSVGS